MTSQSVMVRFVCLREVGGSAECGTCSRCAGRERVGVEVCVVCRERTWIHSTRLHDMTARVVPPPRSMIDRARQTAHKHMALDGTPRHVVVAHLFARDALVRHLRSRSREAKRAHAAITCARSSRCGYLWLRGFVIVQQSIRATSGVPAFFRRRTTR